MATHQTTAGGRRQLARGATSGTASPPAAASQAEQTCRFPDPHPLDIVGSPDPAVDLHSVCTPAFHQSSERRL